MNNGNGAARRGATVLQFPAGGRATLGGRCGYERGALQAGPGIEAGLDLPRVEFGSGWYHEAAVLEARDGVERGRR